MTPQALTKALDFTKSRIFTDIARAPFFGSLMCSYEVGTAPVPLLTQLWTRSAGTLNGSPHCLNQPDIQS